MSIRQTQATEPVPLREAVAGLLALSDERDSWTLRLRASWRAAYRLGLAVGMDLGRRQAEAEQARDWYAIAHPVAVGGIPHDELERRRWGRGGREHFADPRPGDYPGQDGAA